MMGGEGKRREKETAMRLFVKKNANGAPTGKQPSKN
jgi:hypothetical protein